MKRGWIEVRTVRPYEGIGFRVDRNPIEQRRVSKGAIHLALEDRTKIDLLRDPVGELHNQREWCDDPEAGDSMNRVPRSHGHGF